MMPAVELQPPRVRIDQPTDEEADGEEAALEKWKETGGPESAFHLFLANQAAT